LLAEDKLKAMVVVDHASRPLLRYTASKILNAVSPDTRLMLHAPTVMLPLNTHLLCHLLGVMSQYVLAD
jgi:hypothetical protein